MKTNPKPTAKKGIEYSFKFDPVVKCRIVSEANTPDGMQYKVRKYSKYGEHGFSYVYASNFLDNYIIL